MSQQYDNTGKGALFANDRKETDNHPDMKGKLNVDGVEHWFSAWWKTPRNGGEQFLSLSLGKPVEGGQQRPSARSATPNRPPQRPQGRQDQRSSGGDDFSDAPFMDPMKRRGFHLAT